MNMTKHQIAKCLGECRYRPADPNEVGPMLVLQQAWQVIDMEDGRAVGCYTVWRDVPVQSTDTTQKRGDEA